MSEVLQLGKTCAACGTDRTKKSVLYHPETLFAYCENPYVCNEEHPNSPKNIIARGETITLIPYDEAHEKFTRYVALNNPDGEKAEAIRRMVTRPTTIRIGSPELAQFILDLKDRFQFATVSDAIRYCVQQLKEAENGYYQDHKKMAEEKSQEQRIEAALSEVEQSPVKPESEADNNDDFEF